MKKGILFLTLLLLPTSAWAENYFFDVFLDSRPLGQHVFRVNHEGKQTIVTSQASFFTRFFTIFTYRYGHFAKETWENGCLISLKSETRENDGKPQKIIAQMRNGILDVRSEDHEDGLDGCVRSFAYWSQDMLVGATKLLNPQTGRLTPVTVVQHEEDRDHLGQAIPATRLDITGDNLEISVWYNRQTKKWLSLESVLDGRRVVYVLNENKSRESIE